MDLPLNSGVTLKAAWKQQDQTVNACRAALGIELLDFDED
jgi:hypothetical protein